MHTEREESKQAPNKTTTKSNQTKSKEEGEEEEEEEEGEKRGSDKKERNTQKYGQWQVASQTRCIAWGL